MEERKLEVNPSTATKLAMALAEVTQELDVQKTVNGHLNKMIADLQEEIKSLKAAGNGKK
jgi:hypothetical protein